MLLNYGNYTSFFGIQLLKLLTNNLYLNRKILFLSKCIVCTQRGNLTYFSENRQFKYIFPLYNFLKLWQHAFARLLFLFLTFFSFLF